MSEKPSFNPNEAEPAVEQSKEGKPSFEELKRRWKEKHPNVVRSQTSKTEGVEEKPPSDEFVERWKEKHPHMVRGKAREAMLADDPELEKLRQWPAAIAKESRDRAANLVHRANRRSVIERDEAGQEVRQKFDKERNEIYQKITTVLERVQMGENVEIIDVSPGKIELRVFEPGTFEVPEIVLKGAFEDVQRKTESLEKVIALLRKSGLQGRFRIFDDIDSTKEKYIVQLFPESGWGKRLENRLQGTSAELWQQISEIVRDDSK